MVNHHRPDSLLDKVSTSLRLHQLRMIQIQYRLIANWFSWLILCDHQIGIRLDTQLCKICKPKWISRWRKRKDDLHGKRRFRGILELVGVCMAQSSYLGCWIASLNHWSQQLYEIQKGVGQDYMPPLQNFLCIHFGNGDHPHRTRCVLSYRYCMLRLDFSWHRHQVHILPWSGKKK